MATVNDFVLLHFTERILTIAFVRMTVLIFIEGENDHDEVNDLKF